MKIKRILIIGIVVSAFAAGLAADHIASTSIQGLNFTITKGPALFKIKLGGEVVAELWLLNPTRFDMNGVEGPQKIVNGITPTPRTASGGYIEIAAEGLSPWRIAGPGLEIDVDSKTVQK